MSELLTEIMAPAQPELTILIVDDDPNNLGVVSGYLVEGDFTILVAEDGECALERANFALPDLILLDVMMPGIDGYETCRRLKASARTANIPVIFMTALAETEHKVRGFAAGAVDYITKPFQREEVLARITVHLQIRELTRKLQEANGSLEQRVAERTEDLAIANRELEDEIAERQMAQEQLQELARALEAKVGQLQLTQESLRQSEQKFRAIFDQTFQLMGVLTPDGTLLEVNQTALTIAGVLAVDVIDKPFWQLPWWSYTAELPQMVRNGITKAAAGELVCFEANYRNAAGKLYVIDSSLKPVIDDQGRVMLLIHEGRDVTDAKKLEQELRQSQKMEAIGTLAGGIAHDFNNILTAIIGYTEMAQFKLEHETPAALDLERVQAASTRAKELVSRILTFSRKNEQMMMPVKLSAIVDEVLKLLRSSLPTSIDIQQQNTILPNEDTVLVDPTQIHQVLMNLGTNAAHAMRTTGGVLSVSVADMAIDESLSTIYPNLTPGPGIRLTVSDTGHGMEPHVRDRIFDPYFTTKKVGEGSGMGLAVVQGIVKSHGGAISVYSEPGQGTTFQIILPKVAASAAQEKVEELPGGGNERILFVDDEAMLVELGNALLKSLGYSVTATLHSHEALALFRADPQAFDLVITDMTMPGLNGKELAKELKAIRADIPLVLCTGFSELINEPQALEYGIKGFIMKPYTKNGLNKTIRTVLAAVSSSA